MEELIDKIDELIIAINNNSIPLWLSIVGILIPIFISIVVAIQAYIQHNSNKKLQMYISEKEARIQMHSDFLAMPKHALDHQETRWMKFLQIPTFCRNGMTTYTKLLLVSANPQIAPSCYFPKVTPI